MGVAVALAVASTRYYTEHADLITALLCRLLEVAAHGETQGTCTDLKCQSRHRDDSRTFTEEIPVHVGWASERHPNMQETRCKGRCEARSEARCSNA